MKRRIFSVLLCVMMILAILPKVPIMAKTPLTHLDLKGFYFPIVEASPALLDLKDKPIYLNNRPLHEHGLRVAEVIFWDLAPGTVQMNNWQEFKPNNPYKMTVKLQSIMEEADAFAPYEQMTATINGLPAKVYRGNYPYERTIEVTYDYLFELYHVVKEAGDKYIQQDILNNIEIRNPVNMEVYSIDFRDSNGNFLRENEYFDGNKNYLARIYVRPTSGKLPEPQTIVPVVDDIQGEVFGVHNQPDNRSINVVFNSGANRQVSYVYLKGNPEPQAGKRVNLDVDHYKIDEESGKINKVTWMDITGGNLKAMKNGDVFKPGHVYEVSYVIQAQTGMEYKHKSEMTAYLNQNKAQVDAVFNDMYNNKLRVVSRVFPKLEGDDPDVVKPDTVINNLEITTVMEPKVGVASDSDMTLTDEDKFANGVHDWLESDTKKRLEGKPFEVGKGYIFRFEGELKEGYVLAANPTIKINGKQPSNLVIEDGGKTLRVDLEFPALTQAITKLTNVSVNGVTKPKVGEKPNTSISGLTTGDYNYYIRQVEWQDNTNKDNRIMAAGEEFKKDRNYSVIYYLAARPGYQFEPSQSMSGWINGQKADVYTYIDDESQRLLVMAYSELVESTPLNQPIQSTAFLDVNPSDWFYPNVQYVVSKGIMNGIGNNMFDPQGKMTRAMIVTMVHRIAGSPSVSSTPDYSDNMSGQWFTNAVRWTKQKKLADDFLGNQFEPMANLTREQMITILYQYAKLTNKSLTQKGSLSEFGDAGQLENYSQTPMKWAVYQGIIKGTGGNLLNPKGNISRAEVAAIIQRFNELK